MGAAGTSAAVLAVLLVLNPGSVLIPRPPDPSGPGNGTTTVPSCDYNADRCEQWVNGSMVNLSWTPFEMTCEALPNGTARVTVSSHWTNEGNMTAINASMVYRVIWNHTSGLGPLLVHVGDLGARSQRIDADEEFLLGNPCANARATVRGEFFLNGMPIPDL